MSWQQLVSRSVGFAAHGIGAQWKTTRLPGLKKNHVGADYMLTTVVKKCV